MANLCYTVLCVLPCLLHLAMQTATLRILIGMALVALQNFSTGLDHDKARLAGTSTTSNGNGTSSSSSSSSGGAASGNGTGSSDVQAQQEALTPEMQLAVLFRSQKKQLLLDVITGLADKLKQVRCGLRLTVISSLGEIVTRRHVRSQQEWHCLPR
jgi:hypothetical protein